MSGPDCVSCGGAVCAAVYTKKMESEVEKARKKIPKGHYGVFICFITAHNGSAGRVVDAAEAVLDKTYEKEEDAIARVEYMKSEGLASPKDGHEHSKAVFHMKDNGPNPLKGNAWAAACFVGWQ